MKTVTFQMSDQEYMTCQATLQRKYQSPADMNHLAKACTLHATADQMKKEAEQTINNIPNALES